MADGFDRNDHDNGGGSFVMGLLTGTVLGAGLGMLFAPKVGSDLRNQVREQAGNLANTASDGYRRAAETAGQYAERGRDLAGDLAGRAREAAETAGQYAERGRDMASDLAGRAREAVAKGTEEAQRYVRDATGASDMTDRMGSASGSGSSGPSAPGSTGPRPGGSYPTDSNSGGFGGPRG
jgi:gas vesicle protein